MTDQFSEWRKQIERDMAERSTIQRAVEKNRGRVVDRSYADGQAGLVYETADGVRFALTLRRVKGSTGG